MGPLLPMTTSGGLWVQVKVHSSLPRTWDVPSCLHAGALTLTSAGTAPGPLLPASELGLLPQDHPSAPPAPQPGRPATSRFPAELLHRLASPTSFPDRGSPPATTTVVLGVKEQ